MARAATDGIIEPAADVVAYFYLAYALTPALPTAAAAAAAGCRYIKSPEAQKPQQMMAASPGTVQL
ncbi:hypothetical protein MMPV_004405 [Pyropia vietnamensis]